MDEDVRVTKRLWGLPKKNKRGSEPLLPPSRPHQFESPNIHVPALVHFPRTTFMPMSLGPEPILQTARLGPELSCMLIVQEGGAVGDASVGEVAAGSWRRVVRSRAGGASGSGVIKNALALVATMGSADVGGASV